MRDRRFVAAHRGGPLDRESHVLLARWAVDCAERMLPLFIRVSADERPERALEIGRAWAKGAVPTGAAMQASVAAHAAARTVTDKAAIAAARACGQAVATAHFADHSMGALLYSMLALQAAGGAADEELVSRIAELPGPLREMVCSGVVARWEKMGRQDVSSPGCACSSVNSHGD